jgi:hypothetical protein
MVTDILHHHLCQLRSGTYIALQVSMGDGRSWNNFGQVPGTNQQLDIGNAPVYLGGRPNVRRDTNGLFNNGLIGCVIQFRAARIIRQWQTILLQSEAVDGAGVTACFLQR